MENFFLLLATGLAWRISAPKFKRYIIGKTGCTSLLLSTETTLHVQSTHDGERVYFYEHAVKDVTYGLITVHMQQRHSQVQAERVLTQYVNSIRKPFGIFYNTGTFTERGGDAVTLSDYWQDEEEVDWKVKGYSNGKIIAVLYVKNINNALSKEHDAYLNGFRFSSLSQTFK